jgi:AcrR family transcriptional regulator
MPGIREKKKAKTQDDIVRSALELFTGKGYEATTIEEIAERAEVGVGTVYNYFGSKKGLLLAFAAREHEGLHERGARILEKATGDPEAAFSELFLAYFENLRKFDRKLMREIMAASVTEADSIGKEMSRLDLELIGQIAGLIQKFQKLGLMDRTLPVDQSALVLYSILAMTGLVYLAGEQDMGWIEETIPVQIGLIFRGWRS